MLANSFSEPKVAWSEQFRSRANAGWWALSGFSLQMMVALKRFLRAELIERPPREEKGIEEVSDFLIAEDKIQLV